MQKRNWLITGISSGLGKALSQSVMESGDFVIGTFRKKKQVETFNQQHAGNGKAYLLDLNMVEDIDFVVSNAISDFGQIDVLVNNAGTGFVGAIEEAELKEIRGAFEVNVFAPLKLTQAILPHMRRARQGHIIQISSHGGLQAFAGFGIYNSTKFALEGFSEALAQEVSPLGIKLSIVEPGPFRTNFAGAGLGEAYSVIEDYAQTAGAFRQKLKGVHMKQEGDPQKAARAIINMVNMENSPLRLPLGKTALATIEMKLESVKNDLENGRAIAENAVYAI